MNFCFILSFCVDFSWSAFAYNFGILGSDTDCDDSVIEKYLPQWYYEDSYLMTENDGNFVRLSCFWSQWYFPTYNRVDAFTEFECTESGWSLPDDMKPIRCKHVTCPSLLDLGEEIVSECRRRDDVCTDAAGNMSWPEEVNDEKYQHCTCYDASYQCKKESQTFVVQIFKRCNNNLS